MSEAACVLHAFTFPSHETKLGSQVEMLQESVSFGRFATETLAWDKWSSFSNKRYVEEAAKHSHPGLVANKKAFFEAYYKKKALLEQGNVTDGNENCTQEINVEDGSLNVTHPSSEIVASASQSMDREHDSMVPLETNSGIKSGPLDARQLTCPKEKEAIKRDVKTNQEVSEVNAGKTVPACPQILPVPRASSERASSVKGPRVSFCQLTEDITSSTEECCVISETADQNRIKKLFNTPVSESRKCRTDLRMYSESSKACVESKSPIISISSPFGFGTGKGHNKNREKLEEILNSKGSKRVQFQTKMKEKAVSQLKKLRLGFCFCSKPSPDLHLQSKELKNRPKIFAACIQLEKHRTSMKNGCWKHVEKQRSKRQIRPGSLGEKIAHKGKSPTAQIL